MGKQLLCCRLPGDAAQLDTATIEYDIPIGGWDYRVEEARRTHVISCHGKVHHFRVKLDGSPGTGNSYIFTVRVNGANSALSVTISGSETEEQDTTTEVDVSPGDYVTIQCQPVSYPAARHVLSCQLILEPDSKNTCTLMTGLFIFNTDYSTLYATPMSGLSDWITSTQANAQGVIPCDGTLSDLHGWVHTAPDPGGADGCYITIQKNGVDTALQIDIAGNSQSDSDTLNSVSVSAGDLVGLEITRHGTPSVSRCYGGVGCVFTPAANPFKKGFVVLGVSDDYPDSANPTWNNLFAGSHSKDWLTFGGGGLGWRELEVWECRFGYFYVNLTVAPGSGNFREFRVLKNGANTALYMRIQDTATTGSDSDTEDFAEDDGVGLYTNPYSGPYDTVVRWGIWGALLPLEADLWPYVLPRPPMMMR